MKLVVNFSAPTLKWQLAPSSSSTCWPQYFCMLQLLYQLHTSFAFGYSKAQTTTSVASAAPHIAESQRKLSVIHRTASMHQQLLQNLLTQLLEEDHSSIIVTRMVTSRRWLLRRPQERYSSLLRRPAPYRHGSSQQPPGWRKPRPQRLTGRP